LLRFVSAAPSRARCSPSGAWRRRWPPRAYRALPLRARADSALQRAARPPRPRVGDAPRGDPVALSVSRACSSNAPAIGRASPTGRGLPRCALETPESRVCPSLACANHSMAPGSAAGSRGESWRSGWDCDRGAQVSSKDRNFRVCPYLVCANDSMASRAPLSGTWSRRGAGALDGVCFRVHQWRHGIRWSVAGS
jgi:hypothetical protein